MKMKVFITTSKEDLADKVESFCLQPQISLMSINYDRSYADKQGGKSEFMAKILYVLKDGSPEGRSL